MNRPAIIERLAEIRAAHDGESLRAEWVVADAASPESPLHDAGDWCWDNPDAAIAKWRLDVARGIIRSFTYEVTRTERDAAPLYVRDPAQPARVQGYTHPHELNDILARRSLELEAKHIEALVRRFRALASKYELVREGEALLTKVIGVPQPHERKRKGRQAVA